MTTLLSYYPRQGLFPLLIVCGCNSSDARLDQSAKVGSRSSRPRSTGDTATASSVRPQQLHRSNKSVGNDDVFSSRRQQNQRTQDPDYDTLDPSPSTTNSAHPGPTRSNVQDTGFQDTKRAHKWRVPVSGSGSGSGTQGDRRLAGSVPGTPPSMYKNVLSKSSSGK